MILSIIIPTYNREKLIRHTLDSVASGHHPGVLYEVIVVDDGSTDNTVAFIEHHYPGVKLLHNKGKGAAAARNTGLTAAAGKYILYLDSDDLSGAHFFREKIAYLEAHPDVDACYGRYAYFESNGPFDRSQIVFKHKYPQIFSPDQGNVHLLNYLRGSFLPANAIVWRKEMLIKCGGHNEHLKINQDVDLFIRALLKGLRIVAVNDDSEVYIRTHDVDVRVGDPKNEHNKWLQILELRKQLFKTLQENGLTDPAYKQALTSYLFGYWKQLRHTDPGVAAAYLAFAKEVYWPAEIKGSYLYRMIAKLAGPVGAVKLKYMLLKRD